MRRLFIQFYLLLIVCFMVAAVAVGVVYKRAINDMGDRYLSDLLRITLTMIENDLKGVPAELWGETLNRIDYGVAFKVRVERASDYPLDDASEKALERDQIVMLSDSYLFLQRIPNSDYLLVAGPLRYLFFLHQLRWLDYLLLGLIGLSLAIPVLLWMRPHWRSLLALEQAAGALERGQLTERVDLPPRSSVYRLGQAFNRMAESIEALIISKKHLIDAVAHELRTPLARLRYRMAMLEGQEDSEVLAGMERDIQAIDSLIEELLLHSRLDRPEVPLNPETFRADPWLNERLADAQAMAPDINWLVAPMSVPVVWGDKALLTRALDNLLGNARRYAHSTVRVMLTEADHQYRLIVDDDGPGISEQDRAKVLEPFVRLDASRGRNTGGHGLGLAIVSAVARAHRGGVEVQASPLGGARFAVSWPRQPLVHMVTQGNIPPTDRAAAPD
jgi:two-component system sensor histidine kinase RstB